MRSFETLVIWGLCLFAVPLHAETPQARLGEFAVCTGRLSAEREHRWLMQDPLRDETEAAYRAFEDLLETVESDETRRQALSIRIAAKHAHSALLSDAAFGTNASRAAWSSRRARQNLDACLSLLPGSWATFPQV